MIKRIIEEKLGPSPDHIYGFASMEGLLSAEFRDYPFGISIGWRLDDAILDSIENGPTDAYLKHYEETNVRLDALAAGICDALRAEHVKCMAIPATIPSNSDAFKRLSGNLRYKVSHKMVATRAGLGWIGKTDLLITREFGARLRLVSILTDGPVEVAKKTDDRSRCGRCDICVIRCPAQAANGTLWDIHTDRDVFFDAFKCRDKCRELGQRLSNRDARICGICVSVCPVGRVRAV